VLAGNHATAQNILISIGASILATSIFSIFLLATVGNPFDDIRSELGRGMEEFRSLFQHTSAIFGDAERSGLVRVAATRSDMATTEWISRLAGSKNRVFILAYAMDFLSEHESFANLLEERRALGCKVRILLAEPNGQCVNARNTEEVNEGSIKNRVETTIARLNKLVGSSGFELRLYDVPLYCSVFGFDDELIVTPHLYGLRGARAPIMIVREVRGGLFAKYLQHFDDIWATATPYIPAGTVALPPPVPIPSTPAGTVAAKIP
jgi:hypothetical protein